MAAKKKQYISESLLGSLFDEGEIEIVSKPIAKKTPAAKTELSDIVEMQQHQTISQIRFISFGSGSSGNCSYLGTEKEGFLIDAGVDPKKVYAELHRHGITDTMIRGIIFTHDHGDHVRYAYPHVRKHRHLGIFCTPAALKGMFMRHRISPRLRDFHIPIHKEHEFKIAGFTITPFEVSHDGSDNVGFFIEYEGLKFTIATDLGCITDRVRHYMSQANFLVIESNYDSKMLQNGNYPEYLKARIANDHGHLCNDTTATFLAEIATSELKHIFLCHLSKDNNTPEKALQASTEALQTKGFTIGDGSGSVEQRNRDVQLTALPRFDATRLFVLRK